MDPRRQDLSGSVFRLEQGSAEGKGSLLIKNSDIKSSSSSGIYSLDIGFMNKGCIINNSTINSHLINDPDYHEPSRLMQQN